MTKAVINFKTDPKLKAKAQKLATELGVSLSTVLNDSLRRFTQEKKLTLTTSYEPSDYLKKNIEQSMKDLEDGNFIEFESVEEATAYVDKMIQDESN